MEDFGKGISELWLIVGAIIVNQLTNFLRNHITKKGSLSKNVEAIKKEVSADGGNSLNDKIVECVTGIKELRALIEANFAMLFNSENIGIFRADEKGAWTFCNDTIESIFGMSKKEMLGRGWEIAVGKNTRERNDFIISYHAFFTERRPLNEIIVIINQETKQPNEYLITAKEYNGNGIFLFNLGKISKNNG